MEKLLELFSDGRIYEIENNHPTKVIDTEGKVEQLSAALQFTEAKEFIQKRNIKNLPNPTAPGPLHVKGYTLDLIYEKYYLQWLKDFLATKRVIEWNDSFNEEAHSSIKFHFAGIITN